MKRVWCALALLVVVILVSVFGILHTRRVTAQMAQVVEQAKDAQETGDEKSALRLSRQASQAWKDAHPVLCAYMEHTTLSEVDQLLCGLPELCRNGAKDQFLSDCDKVLAQFDYMAESEIPDVKNIF
ncbi:MAG TPA: hypothetical protein DEB16_02540 [Ruminococcaceae bacterium]|jgi:hypothetical protein|nr:hypothetical protein [Oscillospiraceae bacterium]